MRVNFYDIKAQYDELSKELDAAVHEVISTGNYVLGPNHNAFEAEMAELHQCKHGIAVNSGTDALRIALDAQGIGAGAEVITTAFTFVASTETIVQTGAKPVFIDIDPKTFCMDPALIEAAITPQTKAIMPIHLFGQMANMTEICKIAAKHNLPIIEDAAQAVGCTHHGKPAGKFGVGAGISYYVTKNLGAAGDAGLILTDSDEFAAACKSIRIHGMGRQRYYYDHLGYTSRMDEVQAAVLRVKLTRLAKWNDRRGELAAIYLDELQQTPVQLPVVANGNNHTWHQFSILAPKRDELQNFLKDKGIASMIYYPVPIHFHEPYKAYGKGKGSLPITERVCEEVLNLPIHQHLNEDQIQYITAAIQEFYS